MVIRGPLALQVLQDLPVMGRAQRGLQDRAGSLVWVQLERGGLRGLLVCRVYLVCRGHRVRLV